MLHPTHGETLSVVKLPCRSVHIISLVKLSMPKRNQLFCPSAHIPFLGSPSREAGLCSGTGRRDHGALVCALILGSSRYENITYEALQPQSGAHVSDLRQIHYQDVKNVQPTQIELPIGKNRV